MNRWRTLAAVALLLQAGCGAPQPTKTPASPLHIDLLSAEEQREFDGCSCAFYPRDVDAMPEDGGHVGAVLGWYPGGEVRDVPLRVDGRTERLVLLEVNHGPRQAPDGESRRGDRTSYLLANERTRANLTCRVGKSCPSEPSECEGIEYESCDLDVEANGSAVRLKVSGYCGC
jgi:hypothetical protein